MTHGVRHWRTTSRSRSSNRRGTSRTT
jgi:hypothetical protein